MGYWRDNKKRDILMGDIFIKMRIVIINKLKVILIIDGYIYICRLCIKLSFDYFVKIFKYFIDYSKYYLK